MCLFLHATDYGDKFRISELIKKLHAGDDVEINQCANVHSSGGSSGRTSRVPSNHTVAFLSKEFRTVDAQQAEEAR